MRFCVICLMEQACELKTETGGKHLDGNDESVTVSMDFRSSCSQTPSDYKAPSSRLR